jgi:putative membrane protein|tara:strand:+ start:161 stop:796 length:636 start_codon:yes stop_codon:yes gene_type:complete
MRKIDGFTFYALIAIWAFQIFGAIGILFWNREWFINMTPFTLLMYFLILYYKNWGDRKKIIFLLLTFSFGILSEIIGVNTGLIFGSYKYGQTLGFQIMNVPMVMGIIWVNTTLICGTIANQAKVQMPLRILIAISLMLLLDAFIEPIAPRIDMWRFDHENGLAPLSNYITWAAIALPLQSYFIFYKLKFDIALSSSLYVSQLLFFAALYIF